MVASSPALLALLVATAGTASVTHAAERSSVLDTVRGGAWLYHADDGPCGPDPLAPTCQFVGGITVDVTTNTSSTDRLQLSESESLAAHLPSNASSVSLSVSRLWIDHMSPLSVSLNFKNLTPVADDWVGAFCLEDESKPVADSEYLDWQYVTSTNSLAFGPLVNMRCSWQFRYFTPNKTTPNTYVKLATSPIVRFIAGKQQPLHVRVAKTEKATEMRVMWVSARVNLPTVEYGLSPYWLDHIVLAKGDSYAASDMCEAPATKVAARQFRDPGMIYNAVLTNLKPETTYYYRVSGGLGTVSSKTFKFKTPPAPGVQKGVASFFVYGDLGDWNIHATGQLPVKRSGTTMELIRRDMDAPNSNYVAVMHDGDLAYAFGRTYLWDQFGALIEPVASEIPYMIGIGNHEYCYESGGAKDPSGAGATNGFHPPEGNYNTDSFGECGVPTNKRFVMPNNGNKIFWWSTEIGLVHHTQISSEHDYTPGSVMYKWLENDLKSVDRKKTPWLMLHLHRPMYTSEMYESDHRVAQFIRKNIESLLGKYKVDIVFSGHYHAYELTCPVYDNTCRSDPLPGGLQKAKAPVHIMVGSAGADVDNVGYYDVPWRVEAQLEYGYGRVHVHNATHAKWEFVRNRDEIVAGSTWVISDHDWSV
jgi:acid phosphatase type 7